MTGEVKRGDIFQIVSVTGEVKRGEEVRLGFEIGGKIRKIYVKVGDKIKRGEKLAELDKSSLLLQLEKANVALQEAKANYEKLLEGPKKEEVELQEKLVSNAKIELKIAKENLEGGYEKAIDRLGNYFLEAKKIFEEINFQYEQDSRIKSLIKEEKDELERLTKRLKEIYQGAKEGKDKTKIDEDILETEEIFEKIDENLSQIIETSEKEEYKKVMENIKLIALFKKEKINFVLSNLSYLKQELESLKSSLELSEGKLEIAEKKLQLLLAPPTEKDKQIYQSKIKEAELEIEILKNKIRKADLISPLEGEVIKIEKKDGEIVSGAIFEPFIFILPSLPYEIEIDIPETEIFRVKVGLDCEILIDALGEEKFSGKLLEIDPASTIIGGVVYYKSRVSLEGKNLEGIKPGMTATVNIICAKKENTLYVSKRAILEKEGKKIIRVPKDNFQFEEIEIETGLEGSRGEVEIISSLKEGQKIILFVKKK